MIDKQGQNLKKKSIRNVASKSRGMKRAVYKELEEKFGGQTGKRSEA